MMKKYIVIVMMLSLVLGVQAEVVVLHSGQVVEGEILMQNDEIVMLRDKDGRRFQFQRADIEEIKQPEEKTTEAVKEETIDKSKGNCALRLDMSGGGLFAPSLGNGGGGAVDIQIGSRWIGDRRVFLGGSVGYQAAIANKTYHFIPLMAVFSMPLLSGKHAPEIGASLGYGFAIKNPASGGMTTRLDVSWRYQFAPTSAMLLGIQARWQQANVKYMEMVDNKEYYSTLGRNFVHIGLRLALEF